MQQLFYRDAAKFSSRSSKNNSQFYSKSYWSVDDKLSEGKQRVVQKKTMSYAKENYELRTLTNSFVKWVISFVELHTGTSLQDSDFQKE